jgi:hypothetical protein
MTDVYDVLTRWPILALVVNKDAVELIGRRYGYIASSYQ